MKTPTDLSVLNAIYDSYYDNYVNYSRNDGVRSSKNYVPIDCEKIAKQLNVDANIIFGRLYYHLDNIYGYKKDDGSLVHFFAFQVGEDKHCINFPLLSSVLAGLRHENKKHLITTWIAVVAIIFSAISLGVTIKNEIPQKQVNEKPAIPAQIVCC